MSSHLPLRTALLGVVAGVLLSAGSASAQPVTGPMNNQPNPYRTIHGFFKLPNGREWGQTSAVDIAPDGTSIWVAERCGGSSCVGSDVDPVVEFDTNGNVLHHFGKGMFVWPHGIFVGKDGNVWITDGRLARDQELQEHPEWKDKGNVVYEFSPEGEVLMTLGTPGKTGNGTNGLLDQPSDVAVGPEGFIYVADGHGGQSPSADRSTVSRIAKYYPDGSFMESWGHIGSAPGEFRTPHGLAFDSQGHLFVADRGNVRVQVFDRNGKFLNQWKQFGRNSGIFIDQNDMIYTADSESSPTSNPGWKRGIRVGSAVTGQVLYFIPDPNTNDYPRPWGTSAAEGVAVDENGVIYGAEVGPQRLTKYVREESEGN